MTPPSRQGNPRVSGFRARLLVAMMLVVSAVAGLGLLFAQRNVAANVKSDFEKEFRNELAALHSVQEVRHALLAERCRRLSHNPRLHAALEDNALDRLYPSAEVELADVMEARPDSPREQPGYALHAIFYRFLDAQGLLIPPQDATLRVGKLGLAEESRLALRSAPDEPETGYLLRPSAGGGATVDEVVSMPIVSSESGETIAAIVLGFKPAEGGASGSGIRSAIWVGGRLASPAPNADLPEGLAADVSRAVADPGASEGSFEAEVAGKPFLLFFKLLNPGSLYPPAYEVVLFPLSGLIARERTLAWQFAAAGALLVLGAFAASHLLSRRLSAPVEELAVNSEANRTGRERAEAALETTSRELRRSARFSADASHQLKTPVTVLRSGLEDLLAGETLAPEAREEVSSLVHQTFRLTSIIEDLLLLSRMDAGRLRIEFGRVNLTPLIEAWLDDLSALPDGLDLSVETHFPASLEIEGEKRYATLIVQNLLENARKYNRPGGRIRIEARAADGRAVFTVGNTGPTIPAEAREHIFERFHRGAVGENVAGHGLGLNLARELARLHGGDLRLVRSGDDWTEFEATFRLAP